MNWIDLLLLSLAVARLSSLFVNEHGPSDIFERLRIACGVAYDFETGARIVVRPHAWDWLGDVLNCTYCFSVWMASIVWTAYLLAPTTVLILLAPLAIAHVALVALRGLDG